MQRAAEVKAAIFFITAMVLFTLFVWVLGSERQMFATQSEYYAQFKDVKGLAEGAPVRLGGITIGRVSKISFSSDYKNPNINVTLLVNDEYLERMRSDSLVSIETQGLLGDRFVSISMAAGGRLLSPKSRLQTSEPADIAQVIQKAEVIVENTVKISETVNKFLSSTGDDGLSSISQGAKSLANILQQVETGSGVLHNLIYRDDAEGLLIKNLTETSANIRDITGEVREGKGLLHSVIFHEEGKQTFDNIGIAARNLAELSQHLTTMLVEVKQGHGLLHDLIYAKSPQSVADLLVKLNKTAENLKVASDKLASGQGTLGALLIDPQLYENLVEVTDGAKRSFLLREAIKSSLGK